MNGELDPPAAIVISKAVAVQIWQLIFDSSACAELLKDAGKQRFFVILASLALGIRVRDADPNAVDSLRYRSWAESVRVDKLGVYTRMYG